MTIEELSHSISISLDEVSKAFSEFQHKSKLPCPEDCIKCCVKPDISCAPYELLPLALYLLKNNKAELFLDKVAQAQNDRCILLEVSDEAKGMGRCSEYQFRPFICRAFGISARHGKNNKIDYSICRVLKENDHITKEITFAEEEIPFIEIWKKKLEALDPHLSEKEIPINQGLAIILEKVLLWDSFQEK